MEKRKQDLIGRAVSSENINTPMTYNGELDDAKAKLENDINNLVSDFVSKHNTAVQIHKENTPGAKYYVRLVIDVDRFTV